MKSNFLLRRLLLLVTAQIVLSVLYAQNSGFINRQATSVSGRSVLDPNTDGYTSATTSGFGTNDVANSELAYIAIRSYAIEPFGDLRRGPSHLYSDYVPDANSDGFYFYFNGTNLQYRFRLGSIMSGSKGYSVLIDTDGKFGATGANADPNYIPATTGTNGNPGFEIEIVLETNFRIAIYNVDGTSSPVLVKAYTNWQDMSQISIAATNDNGDPDFFMDYYIPFSDLQGVPFNLTTSTPLRMTATTVMSPQAAIGGPKSDIYGVNDALYPNSNDAYDVFINAQPPFTLGGGTGPGAACTKAPTVNTPIGTGTVNISGTWIKSLVTTAPNTATITVYRNGVSVGTVSNVSSGTTWTLNGVTVSNNDVITAKAQAAGESMCQTSNSVTAQGCNSSNTTSVSGAAFNVACVNNRRGMSGIKIANARVRIYTLSAGGAPTLFATDSSAVSPSGFYISYFNSVAGTVWEYNGSNNSGTSDPCSGGPNDIPNGSYYFTQTLAPQCESAPVFGSCVNVTPTESPTVTQAVVYNSTTSLSGKAAPGATLRIYRNGVLLNSATAAADSSFSFTGLSVATGDVIDVYAQTTGNCVSASVSRTVTCFTTTPLINADNNNQVTAGAAITGTSGEPAGTLIRVYSTPATLVATTPVQANGTWSTANAATTPATLNAVAGTSYYATAQNGSCGISTASANVTAAAATSAARCGSITGPVAKNATSVSGTLTGSFTTTTVNLYLDGSLIGSTSTNTAAWGPVTVNSTLNNTLYSNGTLTIGVQESGKQEIPCSASSKITCSPTPAAPIITPTSTSIPQNQTVTYTVTNAVAGTFYAISDSATGASLGQGVWATSNGSILLTTNALPNAGLYTIEVKATTISGLDVCTSTAARGSVNVSGTLPLSLIRFNGRKNGAQVLLNWRTENEVQMRAFTIERSNNGSDYEEIGRVMARGTGNAPTDYDFTDPRPHADVNYYRLKMINTDGTYRYSNTIAITYTLSGIQIQSVSPNPFSGQVLVQYELNKPQSLTLQLIDLHGKIVFTGLQQARAGQNLFGISGLSSTLPGIYILRVISSDGVEQIKLVKQKQ